MGFSGGLALVTDESIAASRVQISAIRGCILMMVVRTAGRASSVVLVLCCVRHSCAYV